MGSVGFFPRGEYDLNSEYERLDVVLYQGSSYVALKNSIGIIPTNIEYWNLIVEKGEKGDKPQKGVDYFTEEDIESLNIPEYLRELTSDSTHRTVTDNEKHLWNNKADISDIPDVSNFATKQALQNETTQRENIDVSLQEQIDALEARIKALENS